MEGRSSRMAWIGVIALITGVIIGYLMGSTNGDRQEQTTTNNTDTTAVERRLELNALMREHAAMAVPALKARFLQQPDADAVAQTLDTNSVAIANAIDAMFGGTKDEFLENWRNHIDYYHDYLTAA